MLNILKKIVQKYRNKDKEEWMIYSILMDDDVSRVRVYIIKDSPAKFRFEYTSGNMKTSFVTRRYLTETDPIEEIQKGIYDRIVSKTFGINISFKLK